jgi:hypothetical protein
VLLLDLRADGDALQGNDHERTVYAMHSPRTQDPKVRQFQRLARVLGVSMDEIDLPDPRKRPEHDTLTGQLSLRPFPRFAHEIKAPPQR